MIRIALLSFWHVHAEGYALAAQALPGVELVAVWDERPERGRAMAERLGLRFFERLDDLLTQPELDAVIVGTPTTAHRAVMVAAAQAGKHIFTEKVLAATLRDAGAILTAVDHAGVKLTVSLPRLNAGYTLAIDDILRRALLGQVTLVRARLSHNGAIRTPDAPEGWLPAHFFEPDETAGGALIDLGCHPMYLTRRFLGSEAPASVSASFGFVSGRAVEDNAVATLAAPAGALGVVEAGFVNRYSPFTVEVHGEEGSLIYSDFDGALHLRSSRVDDGANWQTWSLPPDRPDDLEQWVANIQQGTDSPENRAAAVDLTALMEAANRSAAERRAIRLDELER